MKSLQEPVHSRGRSANGDKSTTTTKMCSGQSRLIHPGSCEQLSLREGKIVLSQVNARH